MLAAIVSIVIAAGAVAALYVYWARRTLADINESADLEWERLSAADPDAIAGIGKDRFVEIFRRVHFPRFPKYALGVVAAFLATAPASLAVMGAIAWIFGSTGLSPDAGALARLIPLDSAKGFINPQEGESVATYWAQDVLRILYYFGLLAAWMVIVFFAMRRYHKRRPGYLRDELLQERERIKSP